MAITIKEKIYSEALSEKDASGGTSKSLKKLYWATGSSSAFEVLAAAKLSLPTSIEGLTRSAINITPKYIDESNPSECLWDITVTYTAVAQESGGPGDEGSFQFTTAGRTEHITQSLDTVSKSAPGDDTPPDFGGAIKVNSQLDVEGADVVAPQFSFSIVKVHEASQVDAAYRSKLFNLTGKVNNAEYTVKGMTFKKGELLFMGATGSQQGTGPWTITYQFLARPNNDGPIKIGDIDVPSKKGFELLWVFYMKTADMTGTRMKTPPKPVAAYVEQVYEYGDFTDLKL